MASFALCFKLFVYDCYQATASALFAGFIKQLAKFVELTMPGFRRERGKVNGHDEQHCENLSENKFA